MNKVTVTPKQAAQWMESNKNRSIRPWKLEAIKEDMIKGRFHFNGDAIRFYEDGSLADGQHRLVACIETGLPFDAIVVYGITRQAALTIDTGSPRNNADALVLHNGMTRDRARDMASACRYLIPHDMGVVSWCQPGGGSTKMLTAQGVFEYYDANSEAIEGALDWLAESVPGRARVLSGGQSIALRILTARVDDDASRIYLSKILSGYDLKEGTTESHIRAILVSAISGARKMNPRVRMLSAAKGFRTISAGRSIKHYGNAGFRDGVDSVPTFPGFDTLRNKQG